MHGWRLSLGPEFHRLPTIEQLVNKSLRKGERLFNAGKSAEEVTKILEQRSLEFRQFLLQGYSSLEDADVQLINNGIDHLKAVQLGAGTLGLLLAGLVGRLVGLKFRQMPRWRRGVVRLGMLVAPFAGAYNYCWTRYNRVALYLEDKYWLRMQFFNLTNNPAMLNPSLAIVIR